MKKALIRWLGCVDKAVYERECDRHDSARKQLGYQTEQCRERTAELDTVQTEYREYPEAAAQELKESQEAYQRLLSATMKANTQKTRGSAWKLNRLARFPTDVAERIRKEFHREYGDEGS